jgi:hypothetical protein
MHRIPTKENGKNGSGSYDVLEIDRDPAGIDGHTRPNWARVRESGSIQLCRTRLVPS